MRLRLILAILAFLLVVAGACAFAQETSNTPPADTKTAPQATEANTAKPAENGGRNDLEAIGNRNVGCGGGLGNWYSLEKQIAIGKQFAQQVESSSRLVQDPDINEYVNRIGQNLVRNSDARVPFTIKVIDSDEVNAFALPGGFFYVNSGLILAADNESELAGVMAHEIAHVAACHAARQMTRSQISNLASIGLIFIGGWAGYGAYQAANMAGALGFMKFSRGFESEADHLGMQYAYKAGYDPQGYITFFEKIQAQEKKKPGTLSKAFASHPQTPDRIAKSQQEIASVLPAREQYVVSTSEFDEVKARLAALQNRRKFQETQEGSRPSLRRSKSPDSKDGKSDEDRPTLQRRD